MLSDSPSTRGPSRARLVPHVAEPVSRRRPDDSTPAPVDLEAVGRPCQRRDRLDDGQGFRIDHVPRVADIEVAAVATHLQPPSVGSVFKLDVRDWARRDRRYVADVED